MITLITKISYFLVPFLFILGGYGYYSFQKLKKIETKKVALILAEISSEKEIAFQLKSAPKEVEKLNKSINYKLLKIKVAIFNLDFSLKEIF